MTPEAVAKDIVVAQCKGVGAMVVDCVTPFTTDLHAFAKECKPSAIVTTTLGTIAVKSVSMKLDIPGYVINMQPNVPTASFPFYISSFAHAVEAAGEITRVGTEGGTFGKKQNYLDSYQALYSWMFPSLPAINEMQHELGLKQISEDDIVNLLKGHDSNVTMILSYPTQLIPTAPDIPDSVLIVQNLAESYLPDNWDPAKQCPQLYEYVQCTSERKPVCINVGSMTVDESIIRKVATAMFSGLRQANVERAILLRGSGSTHLSRDHLSDESLAKWAEEHVFECQESAQFAWLFRHCSAVITHGGAGTTSAAIWAGVPVAIAPMMSDQFFWAEMIEGYRLGACIRPSLTSCTAEAVAKALACVMSKEVIENARGYRRRQVELESGCESILEILRSEF